MQIRSPWDVLLVSQVLGLPGLHLRLEANNLALIQSGRHRWHSAPVETSMPKHVFSSVKQCCYAAIQWHRDEEWHMARTG